MRVKVNWNLEKNYYCWTIIWCFVGACRSSASISLAPLQEEVKGEVQNISCVWNNSLHYLLQDVMLYMCCLFHLCVGNVFITKCLQKNPIVFALILRFLISYHISSMSSWCQVSQVLTLPHIYLYSIFIHIPHVTETYHWLTHWEITRLLCCSLLSVCTVGL